MGFFDFMTGSAAPQTPAVNPTPAEPTQGQDWTALFKDPNFIQFLAGMGMAADLTGAGGTIGGPVQNWSKNLAFQQAAAKQGERNDAQWQEFLKVFGGQGGAPAGGPAPVAPVAPPAIAPTAAGGTDYGVRTAPTIENKPHGNIIKDVVQALHGQGDVTDFVGDPTDPFSADSITIGPKGVNVKLPKSLRPPGSQGAQAPLEAQAKSTAQGRDFSPFSQRLVG